MKKSLLYIYLKYKKKEIDGIGIHLDFNIELAPLVLQILIEVAKYIVREISIKEGYNDILEYLNRYDNLTEEEREQLLKDIDGLIKGR